MHFMPFLTRSGHFSSCLPTLSSTITTTTAINVITIATIIFSFTSVTARVIRNPEKSENHPLLSFEDLQKQLIVEEFKKRILDHMGWSEPPKSTGGSRNITKLRELYQKEIQEFLNATNQDPVQNDYNDIIESQETDKTLKFHLISSGKRLKLPVTRGSTKSSRTTSTIFHLQRSESPDLDDHRGTYSLQSAILSLRFGHVTKRQLMSTKSRFLVKVYLVDPNSKSPAANVTSKFIFLQSFFINPRKLSNVINLDVQSHLTLSSLLSKHPGDKDITFKITVTQMTLPFHDTMSSADTKIFKSPKFSKSSHSHINVSPSLEVKLLHQIDKTKSRSRRSMSCSDDNSACCNRESIYIDFEGIGFSEWVLAPQGYRAYYCRGLCPMGFKAVGTFSRIKAKMHEQNPDFPAPNCASSSYAPLKVMHLDDMDRIEWTTFEDMVVTGCKCY